MRRIAMTVLPVRHLSKFFMLAAVLAGANRLIELRKQNPPTRVITVPAAEAAAQGTVYVPQLLVNPISLPQVAVRPQARWSSPDQTLPSASVSAHTPPTPSTQSSPLTEPAAESAPPMAKSIGMPGGAMAPPTTTPLRKSRKLRRIFGVLGKAVLANVIPGGAAVGNTVQAVVTETQHSNVNQTLPLGSASAHTVPLPSTQSLPDTEQAAKRAPAMATKSIATPTTGGAALQKTAAPARKPGKLRRIFGAVGKAVLANVTPGGAAVGNSAQPVVPPIAPRNPR